jgi:hypothetical protein
MFNKITITSNIENIQTHLSVTIYEKACFMKMMTGDNRGTTAGRSTYWQN